MLGLLIWVFWFALMVYVFWFFFKAATFQPLTLDDLALTWKIHKQQTECTALGVYGLIIRNNEVVGFKCECGYEYIQKRLITQKPHTYPAQINLTRLKESDKFHEPTSSKPLH